MITKIKNKLLNLKLKLKTYCKKDHLYLNLVFKLNFHKINLIQFKIMIKKNSNKILNIAINKN